MDIVVAGAGAGKTTSMVDTIVDLHEKMDERMVIFCVAFTNTAVECIKEKIVERYGCMPQNIIVSTIHSFLYSEFIKPYYYLLYKKQYEKISVSQISKIPKNKNASISKLESNNLLHQTVIPKRAKWIVNKKSSDNKMIRDKREVILNVFQSYCGAICVDEAQDIDGDMFEIIKTLDAHDIKIKLMGDPKQDVRGKGFFRRLIEEYADKVEYNDNCFRCPEQHLILTNSLIRREEQQRTNKKEGEIIVVFESEKTIQHLLKNEEYDLKFISERNGVFETHVEKKKEKIFDTIFEEIIIALCGINPSEEHKQINLQKAYQLTNMLLDNNRIYSDKKTAIRCTFNNIIRFDKGSYARIINTLPDDETDNKELVYVSSIDNAKGREGNKCLFILTTDVAAYLFGSKKEENRVKNRLYVALTRSLENLTIYITWEVEEKYGKDSIVKYFERFKCIFNR